MDQEERRRRIAALAYAKAQARGGAPGSDLDDWLDAEREIDAMLAREAQDKDEHAAAPASVAPEPVDKPPARRREASSPRAKTTRAKSKLKGKSRAR